jgi:hypothetical protein
MGLMKKLMRVTKNHIKSEVKKSVKSSFKLGRAKKNPILTSYHEWGKTEEGKGRRSN